MRSTTAKGQNSSEETVVERGARTILSRYEDHTTAPHDTLSSLQIVNNAKMTVHYHFHDHQHAAEVEAPAKAVEESTDQQQPVARIDNPSSFEQPEPGEIQDIPSRSQSTMNCTTGAAKRTFSGTGSADTGVHPSPAKRMKKQDSHASEIAALAGECSLQAHFANPRDQFVPGEPAKASAPKTKPTYMCRHCQMWFTDRENTNSACGVHTGKCFQNVPSCKKLSQKLTIRGRTKDRLQMGHC